SSWLTNAYGRATSARKHHRTKELHKRSECTCRRSFARATMFGYRARGRAPLHRRTIMTMNRRKFLGAGMGAVALAGTNPPVWAQRGGPFKIGASGPMSGNAAAQGKSLREAVEMVVNLKNSAGGVLGRQIELVVGDDAGKPEEAAVIARRFATRDEVSLAIGSVSSPASLAAAQIFREEEVPQIVVSGTAQRITTQGNEWVFRSAVPDRKL